MRKCMKGHLKLRSQSFKENLIIEYLKLKCLFSGQFKTFYAFIA